MFQEVIGKSLRLFHKRHGVVAKRTEQLLPNQPNRSQALYRMLFLRLFYFFGSRFSGHARRPETWITRLLATRLSRCVKAINLIIKTRSKLRILLPSGDRIQFPLRYLNENYILCCNNLRPLTVPDQRCSAQPRSCQPRLWTSPAAGGASPPPPAPGVRSHLQTTNPAGGIYSL